MSITVKFPNNEDVVFEQGKPVVILGANGSGKTRLGVRIDELNDKRFNRPSVSSDDFLIHRISAQKSLIISDKIALTDFDSSWRALFYGDTHTTATKQFHRYGGQYSRSPATHPIDDFDNVLALLFAEDYKELQEYQAAIKTAIKKNEDPPQVITTVRENTVNIWNDLLPQRKIGLVSGNIHAEYSDSKYHGKEMSDGERIMLYMICQTLILPKNSIIIIDEPEMHIHKAIVKKLWDRLEQERQDCVFMYITHDLDFAASRDTDKILWVKSYDGTEWEYEFLDTLEFDDLSDELLFEIIGTRKKILFVEGTRNSYDYALYSEYFKDKEYHVIPCGGCREVINIFKAKKTYEKLNSIEAHCIIDRDFRAEAEITALKSDGIAFLEVAEVENLFIVPVLLDIMEEQLGCETGASQQAKEFIASLFAQTKANQIGEAFIKEVNHQLTILNFEEKAASPADLQSAIADKFTVEAIQSYFDEKQSSFDAATTLDSILKVYNFKELSAKIGCKFGLHGNSYPQRVLNLLKTNPNGLRDRIIAALKPYIPDLP